MKKTKIDARKTIELKAKSIFQSMTYYDITALNITIYLLCVTYS